MKRTNVVAALVAGSLAVGGGGFFLGKKFVKSPRDIAATDAPPAASRIVAEVEFRALASVVRTRGDVRFGSPKPVILASSVLRPANLLVTVTPEKQKVLVEGDRALEVGDRPVFVLSGGVPMYRDLRPGDEGDDVRQLEEALARLAYSPGLIDGKYDSETGLAVDAWYRKAGFEPFGLTDEQRSRLKNARDELSRASDQVLGFERSAIGSTPDKRAAAEETLRSAKDRISSVHDDGLRSIAAAQLVVEERESALVSSEAARAAADSAVEKSRREAIDTLGVDQAQAGLQKAIDALTEASSTVNRTVLAFNDSVKSVDSALKNAGDASLTSIDARVVLSNAQTDLTKAKLKGTSAATGTAPIVIVDPETVTAGIRSAESALLSAAAGVRNAEAGERLAADQLAKAQASVVNAQGQVGKAQTLELEAKTSVELARKQVAAAELVLADRSPLVTEAETKLRLAARLVVQSQSALDSALMSLASSKRAAAVSDRTAAGQVTAAAAALKEALRPSDSLLLGEQLVSARAVKTRAEKELASIEQRAGFVVPANEVLFFPKFPVRIDDTKLERGDPVGGGAVMTVTSSRLALDSDVDTPDTAKFRKGSVVDVQDQELQIGLKGTVTDIAARPGTKGVDASRTYIEVSLNEKSVRSLRENEQPPTDFDLTILNGRNVQLDIEVSTTGKAVFVVPVSALRTGLDEKSYVDIQLIDSPTSALRALQVTPGLKDGAVIEITPLNGELRKGMQVVVGSKAPSDGAIVFIPGKNG